MMIRIKLDLSNFKNGPEGRRWFHIDHESMSTIERERERLIEKMMKNLGEIIIDEKFRRNHH